MQIIYLLNNNCVELRALTNSATNIVDTGATVEVTIRDSAGVAVTGQTWPAAMSHVSAGTYRATLEEDIAILANRPYRAFVDATGSSGEKGHWELPLRAMVRTD